MAGTELTVTAQELTNRYSRCVYCKMLCPIYDCSTLDIPENQDLENGEEFAFVVKPDKITLYLLPLPCPLLSGLCGPCFYRSFDVRIDTATKYWCIVRDFSIFLPFDILVFDEVHTIWKSGVSKTGQLRITQYSVCGTIETAYDDIVGMRSSVTHDEGNALYSFEYTASTGDAGVALTSGSSNISIGDRKRAMEAINTFLKHRKPADGGDAHVSSSATESCSNDVSALAIEQQPEGAVDMDNQESFATTISGQMQEYPVGHLQHGAVTMNKDQQSQPQVPMETSTPEHLGRPETPHSSYHYPQPHRGEPPHVDAQTAYHSGASSYGIGEPIGDLNYVADPSSAFQPQEPPPYQMVGSRQGAASPNVNYSNDDAPYGIGEHNGADNYVADPSSAFQPEEPPPYQTVESREGAASPNVNSSNDDGNDSSQRTSSAHQPEEPPPSYQI